MDEDEDWKDGRMGMNIERMDKKDENWKDGWMRMKIGRMDG